VPAAVLSASAGADLDPSTDATPACADDPPRSWTTRRLATTDRTEFVPAEVLRRGTVIRIPSTRSYPCGDRGASQEMAASTSSATFFSTAGLHFPSAYDTGHTSPSSRFAASWKPRVE